jgi:hypothetical protein
VTVRTPRTRSGCTRALPSAALVAAALLPAALSLPDSAAAAKRSSGPTPSQVRAAVSRATHSRNVWATVNICNTRRHPDVVGFRVQMPGLGFAANLYADVQVEYWSAATRHFRPVPNGSGSLGSVVRLGRATTGTHQSGVTFVIKRPPSGVHFAFRGVATFRWKRGNKVLGSTTRNTGHGYPHVDFGDPAGYSAGTCTIG